MNATQTDTGVLRFAHVLRVARGTAYQADFAAKLGRSQASVSSWEAGRALPSAAHWPQLANALALPVADLICLLAWQRSAAVGGLAQQQAQAAGRRLMALIEKRHAEEAIARSAEHAREAAALTIQAAQPVEG